jgi:hypothetical protein
MWKKIKSYLRFWNKKPKYHMDGAAYGGLRIDIDKYYQEESNKKKLEEINNSAFGKMFDEKGDKNQEFEESSSAI